ncbi:helix-turn-helix domain-containing protein [Vagococcus salmoninarum]|uniref:HTH cro/C1-type domain-containing protein n=1 Tax=Vagococcus salmoninarum TaxID=2739 RepID=A0A429ZWH0_9ENTE|nr:helix-turn-helix transcriptional regulator [Vagococcus salmoninarum]RST97996.1 hypothetical protein CBF35_01520 [Vagococcus salmoninarum]
MKIAPNKKEIQISMIKKGVNQKEVSLKVGLTPSAFSNFINGRTSVSSSKAKKISDYLEKDFETLFILKERE